MFDRLARAVEHGAGSPWAFGAAGLALLVWAATGPLFQWSDTWQLVCNTGTTIVTFLMVFLIQSTQSRDTAAIHLKLDELIRVTGPARDAVIGVENREQALIDALRQDIRGAP